jgi:hypothetical protein
MVPETPCTMSVRVVCPECDQALQVEMEVTSELHVVTDMDEEQLCTLKPKVKAQKIAHRHNQRTLDDAPARGT